MFILRDTKRIIHELRDSILSKFGRGERYRIYTWKNLKSTCSSMSLVTPIFRAVGYERRNNVALQKNYGRI